ncbi:CatA-like O-acetyltransferase [Bacillus massiliigorillae]|uniref:CatA-like O-acetyltransferase n=1 Tax=Bacillus massiliigorillae TaxID=1243664 RepID=UPI00039F419E|nr:CatA-like O-acetyltransferase [Bacillus massiliigorillae]
MSNTYQIIDVMSWKRQLHCQIFRNALQPQYNVCLELDVTHFCKKIKENGWPFSLAFIYTVTKCANDMEEFRYRFLKDDIVLYDTIHTSFTYLNQETELFKVVNVPMQDTIEDYINIATQTIENQKEYITGPVDNDVYQFSSLPWISFTHLSHTISGQKDKSNPMFDWGKYYEKDGKLMLPFSVQVHHSFIDGFHIGKLVERLQSYLNDK